MGPSGGEVGWSPAVVRWLGPRRIVVCSKKNAVSVVVTCEVVGTLNH